MKFARYLEETQVPEWKKAYIDYRSLKKQINAIENYGVVVRYGTTTSFENSNRFQHEAWKCSSNATTRRYRKSSFTLRPPSTFDLLPEHTPTSRRFSTATGAMLHNPAALMTPVKSIALLLPALNPSQALFFDMLDVELDKIELFYLDREKEARVRFNVLKKQLYELQDHRRLFNESHLDVHYPWLLSFSITNPSTNPTARTSKMTADSSVTLSTPLDDAGKIRLDPDDYQNSRKTLKKAVLEFYRTLEVLNNYRTLNLIGFQKALKKFDKVTRISAQKAYIREMVEPTSFSSTKMITKMLKDTEELFISHFSSGDKKRALSRLRAGSNQKSHHHFTSLRIGLALGLAIPAFASGLYLSFDRVTQEEIPAWGGLLYIYSTLLVPVFYSLLVGLNLLVWHRERINYTFIFELDVKTKLDFQEYFEIPAIMLATLSCAFWLSFARIGSSVISPTTWPLIWLAFCALFLFNPLPVCYRSSRFWLFRKLGRLLKPGFSRVEFTDFWMGDQFCSLAFPLSNLYFFSCIYTDKFSDSWRKCASPPNWSIPFILASLPLVVRLIQTIRRWRDLRCIFELINVGKYASGIAMYACSYNWRAHNSRGDSFVLYCLIATIYSIYGCAWDFLMDWSVFKIRGKQPSLRDEFSGEHFSSFYHLAILTNVVIRFAWVIYTPARGPNPMFRAFCVGLLEVFRRWVWNFYRLENEHRGNMDQYRATREVPLPYTFTGDRGPDSDDYEDEHHSFFHF